MYTIYADVSHNNGQIIAGRWMCNAKSWAERIADYSIKSYNLNVEKTALVKQWQETDDATVSEEIRRRLWHIDRDLKFYAREISIDSCNLSN